jgi:hypothetical protein
MTSSYMKIASFILPSSNRALPLLFKALTSYGLILIASSNANIASSFLSRSYKTLPLFMNALAYLESFLIA